jgi:putative membrane protein
MYWDHMNGWGWTMMVIWSLIGIGFLGVIAWAAVRWIGGGSQNSGEPVPPSKNATKTARDVLDERLAVGEIDVDEYRRRRAALEDGSRERVPV